jgi:hypothetical protein
MPSYYEVLGVAPDADQAAVRSAYLAAARAGDGSGHRPLDEAFAVLGAPDRRARYDALLTGEGSANAELLALLDVIADSGGIPSAVEVLRDGATPPLPGAAPEPAPPAPPAPVARRSADPATPRAERFGPVGDPPRRRGVPAAIAVGLLAGLAVGLLLARGPATPSTLEVGSCVALGPDQATEVDCGTTEDAIVSAVVTDPADCPAQPLGTLDLGGRGAACLDPR